MGSGGIAPRILNLGSWHTYKYATLKAAGCCAVLPSAEGKRLMLSFTRNVTASGSTTGHN
jgi:hypothetical protein